MTSKMQETLKKRRETLAARKADAGCDCHHVDLLLCPNYKLQEPRRRAVIHHTSGMLPGQFVSYR